ASTSASVERAVTSGAARREWSSEQRCSDESHRQRRQRGASAHRNPPFAWPHRMRRAGTRLGEESRSRYFSERSSAIAASWNVPTCAVLVVRTNQGRQV